jgi:hypothetical protein
VPWSWIVDANAEEQHARRVEEALRQRCVTARFSTDAGVQFLARRAVRVAASSLS